MWSGVVGVGLNEAEAGCEWMRLNDGGGARSEWAGLNRGVVRSSGRGLLEWAGLKGTGGAYQEGAELNELGGVWLNERGRGLRATGRGLNEVWGLMERCWVLLGGTGGSMLGISGGGRS